MNDIQLFEDMPADEYFTIPAVSKSGLDKIAISPLTYKYSLDNKPEVSKILQTAFDVGSLTHSLILEGNTKGFIQGLDINKNTNIYKAFVKENADKIVVDSKYFELAKDMQAAVLAHPIASGLLKNGIPEASVFATLSHNNKSINAKCRPDWFSEKYKSIVDLKTVSSLEDFEKGIYNHRYFVQDAFYTDVCRAAGFDITTFKFIAVSKSYPIQVAVYELDYEYKELGRITYKQNLDTLIECMTSDNFGYKGDNTQITVSKPNWVKSND